MLLVVRTRAADFCCQSYLGIGPALVPEVLDLATKVGHHSPQQPILGCQTGASIVRRLATKSNGHRTRSQMGVNSAMMLTNFELVGPSLFIYPDAYKCGGVLGLPSPFGLAARDVCVDEMLFHALSTSRPPLSRLARPPSLVSPPQRLTFAAYIRVYRSFPSIFPTRQSEYDGGGAEGRKREGE